MSNSDFHDYVINDLLSEIPGITSRKMFGGYGIYKDPPTSMSYWELPPEIMDHKDALKTWVEKSVQVSIAAKKSKKKS